MHETAIDQTFHQHWPFQQPTVHQNDLEPKAQAAQTNRPAPFADVPAQKPQHNQLFVLHNNQVHNKI